MTVLFLNWLQTLELQYDKFIVFVWELPLKMFNAYENLSKITKARRIRKILLCCTRYKHYPREISIFDKKSKFYEKKHTPSFYVRSFASLEQYWRAAAAHQPSYTHLHELPNNMGEHYRVVKVVLCIRYMRTGWIRVIKWDNWKSCRLVVEQAPTT